MNKKICKGKWGCGKELPLTEFYKNKSSKDGLKSYCKECSKAQMRIENPIRNEKLMRGKSHTGKPGVYEQFPTPQYYI